MKNATIGCLIVLAFAVLVAPASARVTIPNARFLVLASTGSTPNAPGLSQPFSTFGTPYINRGGDVVFGALTPSSGGVWLWRTDTATLSAIALLSTPAPGGAGATFSSLGPLYGDPVLSATRRVAFTAELSGVAGASGTIASIWLADASGNTTVLSLVACAGITLGSITPVMFSEPLVNDAGNVLFRARDGAGTNGVYFWKRSTALVTEVAVTGAVPAPPLMPVASVRIGSIPAFDINNQDTVALLLRSSNDPYCSGRPSEFHGIWSGQPSSLAPLAFSGADASGTPFGESHGLLKSDLQVAHSDSVLAGKRFVPPCPINAITIARTIAVDQSGGQSTLIQDDDVAPGTADPPESEKHFFLAGGNCATANTDDQNRCVLSVHGVLAFLRQLTQLSPDCGGPSDILSDCDTPGGILEFEEIGVWLRLATGGVRPIALSGRTEWGSTRKFTPDPGYWGVRPAISANGHVAFEAVVVDDPCVIVDPRNRVLSGVRSTFASSRTHLLGIDDSVQVGTSTYSVASYQYGQFGTAIETTESGRGLLSDCGAAPVVASLVPASGPSLSVVAVTLISNPADYNGDGMIGIGDLFAFLALWFAGDPAGDFNGDGVISQQDLYDFLAFFFEAGLCTGYEVK